MSRRNKIHKQNKLKGQREFFDTKASFVAGVVLIVCGIEDIVEMCTTVSPWIILIECMCILTLFTLALATKKLDSVLEPEGVKKFGSYLTVMSIVFTIVERLIIAAVKSNQFIGSNVDDKVYGVIVLAIIILTVIIMSLWLLCRKYPKKK